MKRILITGANGQLGLALNQILSDKSEYQVYLTGRRMNKDNNINILDITDEAMVKSVVSDITPHIIINCAAMTAVDLCETEKDKAYRVNALGPKHIAKAASKIGAKLIHVSTDYVYDGQAGIPYTEDAEPNPISVYGNTKLAGDKFVMKYCPNSFILHTAWVYGQGRNFVKTMLRLADEGKRIRVVSDQIGTPTSALELARAIIYLMDTDSYGKYHATCEGSTSWYEFALKIFEMTGRKIEVQPIKTKEYPTPAKRPMYSVLDNKNLREGHGYYMKQWEEALREYVDKME